MQASGVAEEWTEERTTERDDEVSTVHAVEGTGPNGESVDTAPAAVVDPGAAPPADSAETSMVEKRLPGASTLAVFLDFDGPTTLLSGFDGSVHGVFVATHDLLALGTAVTVVVCLPDGSRFDAEGEVTFHRQERDDDEAAASWGNATDDGHWPGIGVLFQAVPADAQEALEAFTAIRPPLFYPD